MSNLFHGLIYLFLVPLLISARPNYYWREYIGGEIPEDAVVGGQKKSGDNVYIGQVYHRPNTLLVVQINPRIKKFVTRTNETIALDKNVKILCGPPKNFVWVSKNSIENIENAVRGGHSNNKNLIVGRIRDGDDIRIGSTDDFKKTPELLVYVNQDTVNSSTWEVQDGYYWREYDGSIPVDAFPGGKDIHRKNIFIGQATVDNGLVVVVRIVPGLTEVENPLNGAKIDNFIKILCGNPKNFEWVSTTASTLQVSLIDKHAVIGGHIEGGGYLWIGRISSCNEIKIGMIACCNVNENLLLPEKSFNVGTCSAYQVLTEK